MKIILFDDDFRSHLQPLSTTRPVADFRVGIFTIREKWEKWLQAGSSTSTADHLEKFQWKFSPDPSLQNIWINSRVLPSPELVVEILALKQKEAIVKGETVIALNNGNSTDRIRIAAKDHLDENVSVRRTDSPCIIIHRLHDIFSHNGKAILQDIELMRGMHSEKISSTNRVIGTHAVLAGKNVNAECCIFNTTNGPIFIGENAEIMEGSLLRGPLAIGNNVVIKMGTRIYGDTTIGNSCKVGGEISNSVFFGNSNKAHEGFIGNSVIGEWCNLGADTNCSNLKNNYGNISVYNYAISGLEDTGMQFHGLIMGDHSRCGINTMFNTGTVVGVCSNVFGGGFPQKFIPDFSWGGMEGFTDYEPEKSFESIARMRARRKMELTAGEKEMLREVFRSTASLRKKQH
ncbi:MAG: glucose-1-phosphate thymidylyltransferase [Bacteroidetes bacterium]|nr:glucose-1-phosphate thymidylyltransferase [Bacteroidota bacterium]